MAKQRDFNNFLSEIEPSSTTVAYISSLQSTLRDYLKNHDTYKKIHVDTFLSGSYAKHTSIRPTSKGKKRDVDIIVVTSYEMTDDSKKVISELKDVLIQNANYNSATIQSHSVGIEMGGLSIDVVPVISDQDDEEVYYIGDSNTGEWTKTDPKGHKVWSTTVNKEHNKKYKPLVKIFKWWRQTNCPEDIKYPKGITLEKIIADNLGDSSLGTEDFLIATMQNIVATYKEDYADARVNPTISDPSEKIEGNDLLAGYSTTDFSNFIDKLSEHVSMLNDEGTENDTWRKILGDEFPKEGCKAIACSSVNNVYSCIFAPYKEKPRWPMQRGGAAFITLRVTAADGSDVEYISNDIPLEKRCTLHFRALTGVRRPYSVIWQVVNTGQEATMANCLRGNFEPSNEGFDGKRESTLYKGTHSVQCFIIKNGICVAKSKEFIVNIR